MKNAFKISFVYIGLVIGAGFASGREIFEYFSLPAQTSPVGIALATIAFSFLCFITMSLAKNLHVSSFDEFIKAVTPRFAFFVKLFMSAFMFCGFFVMLSAAGTIFEESLDLPFTAGVLAITVLCFVVFVFDIKGLVAINTLLVPLMLAGIIALCVSSLVGVTPVFSPLERLQNNVLLSALCYVSYNTITAGAVLVPLSENASTSIMKRSAIISGIILGFAIFLIWFAMNLYFDALINAEMPLLELASRNGPLYSIIFSTVLFMALCTTAIAHGFGLLAPLKLKKLSDRILASALLCLLAMPFARFGFSILVSKLYSVFGFLGLIWTGILIFKYMRSGDDVPLKPL